MAASCVFWIQGTHGVFATAAEDHGGCSVGSLTHGFKTMQEMANNADVAALGRPEWVTPEAVAMIAVVRDKPTSWPMGPLRDMSVEPSVILLRAERKAADAAARCLASRSAWKANRNAHIPIPIAKESGEIAVSLGCMLSRVRTGMSEQRGHLCGPGEPWHPR